MVQTISFLSNVAGINPCTPLSRTLFADINIAAGANCSVALPNATAASSLGYYACFTVKFKAFGTVLSLSPLFSTAAAGTGAPQFGAAITNTNLNSTSTPVNVWIGYHLTDITANGYFCLYSWGTLTGTYTIDALVEIYPFT